jgi:hypothetical protein
MTTIIHIDPEAPLHVLDEHGWIKGSYGTDAEVCLHGAIRLCQPVPGDAQIIEQVAERQGWGTGWNDAGGTTEQMVRDRLALGIDITDDALADTFGPQWRAVVNLVHQSASLTPEQAKGLDAARDATRVAAWVAAGVAARVAAGDAARVAAGNAAWAAAGAAAWDAAWNAAGAIVTYDLATPTGPYTIAQRDLLLAPWISVMGPIEGLVDNRSNPKETT